MIKNLFYILLAIISFSFIKVVNTYMLMDQHYGDQVFYLDPIFNLNQELFMDIPIRIALIYLTLSFIIIGFNKEIYSLFSKIKCYFNISDFILIFFISVLYKVLVYQFNFLITISPLYLEKIFVDGYFNDYKLYNYFAYSLSLITENYESIIFIIQVLLGSLTTSVFFLICIHVTRSNAISFLISLFLIMYMPFIAIHMYLWIDIFYMFFFILSFYFLFESMNNDYKKNIKYFLLTMLVCTLLREQTLYMLPLYLFYILINSHAGRLKLFIMLTLTVIIPSLIISWSNIYHYGLSSNMKSKHLVVKSIQYGYLNETIRPLYESKLDNEASLLLDALNDKYRSTILPHKRIAFKDYLQTKYEIDLNSNESEQVGIKNIIKKKINRVVLPLMRPDQETIRKKSLPITTNDMAYFYDNIELIKKELVTQFQSNKDSKLSNSKTTSDSFEIVKNMFESTYDKNTIIFFKSIVDQYCSSEGYKIECVISTLRSNVKKSFIMTRSDNYYYSKIGMEMADNYNTTSRNFDNHEYINKIDGIILSYPQLYVTQSMLTATSMVGRLSVEDISIGDSLRLYDNNFIPSFFLGKHFQRSYALPVNLWYLFSLMAIVGTLFFIPYSKNRNSGLLTALIPLYYGFFLSFATYAEFFRLFIIMSPFLFLNFVIVLIFFLRMVPYLDKKFIV